MPVRLCVFLGSIAAAALGLSSPACAQLGDEPLKLADSQLEPVKWGDVEGWVGDDHLAAFAAFQASCQTFRNAKRPDDDRPIYNALREVCRRAFGAAKQQGSCAPLLRGQFSPGADHPSRGSAGLSDRLLRADRRGLALSQSRISRAPLPAAA